MKHSPIIPDLIWDPEDNSHGSRLSHSDDGDAPQLNLSMIRVLGLKPER